MQKSGDGTLPGKHLGSSPERHSVPGWWRKWSVNRTLLLFLHPGHLLNTFVPLYPEQLWIEVKTFCNAFPFHVVFDESVRGPFSLELGLGILWGPEHVV